MINDRELVLNLVQNMPETISLREIIDELSLLEQVTNRLSKNPQKNGIPPEEVLKMLDAWTAESPRPRPQP